MYPDFANGFVGSQAVESLERLGEVAGHDECFQVRAQLRLAVVKFVAAKAPQSHSGQQEKGGKR